MECFELNKEVKIVNKSHRVAIIEYLITFDLNISLLIDVVESNRYDLQIYQLHSLVDICAGQSISF
jgi:hypothetical protein